MVSEFSFKSHLVLLLDDLGFSKTNLVSEKEVACLCPLLTSSMKRFDLLYCLHFENRVEPLLLIECKTERASRKKAKKQVANYNYFIQAPFIAVACPEEFEITSPQEEIRKELALLKLFPFSEFCLGWPWWKGIPLCSSLKEIVKTHRK